MYMQQVIEESLKFNGSVRIRTKSGDVLEGKFNQPETDHQYGDALSGAGTLELVLTVGGKTYINLGMIESITLVSNLDLLEKKASEEENHVA